jgi:hypothetical protein
MRRLARAVAVSLLAVSAAGCADFLTGPGLTKNPNSPVDASTTAQFVAVQANLFTLLQGQVARSASIYTQQLMGSNNQQLIWGTQYGIVEGDISTHFNSIFTGSGLVGLRKIQAQAATNGDALLEGMAKIWEAHLMGMAASVWGDLPYSEAATADILTPKLDPQQAIYTAVLRVLDEGIAKVQGAASAGNCDPSDLVYCATSGPRSAQITRWVAAANTLKARFNLHLAERNGNAAYTAAQAAAERGILEVPANATQAMHGQGPGDYRAFHGSTIADGNIWAQFLNARQDIVAGNTLVQLLRARNDPRLTAYFDVNAQGQVVGWSADGVPVGTGAGSVVNTAVRRAFSFRQPFVTWAENQLILAEAKFRLGNAPGALPHVNAVRAAVGVPQLTSVTIDDVMNEKFIAQFQNIDAWNDYKRTCIPRNKPYLANLEVPGRLPYGSAERTANPNIPLPAEFPAKTTGASPLRNWNDPTACPRP